MQFVFAGKAHPKDDGGKKFIQEVYKFTREPEFEDRIVFIEDYDTYIGRRLTQGVDLWLNNPLRPLEASGTSGMKLPPNGGLNLSVLDGWWCEGYNGKNGWAIGAEITDGTRRVPERGGCREPVPHPRNAGHPALLREARRPPAHRLAATDARIDPQRDAGVQYPPHGEGIQRATLRAGSGRPAPKLAANGCAKGKKIGQWKARMRQDWPQVRITDSQVENADKVNIVVGETLKIKASVHLGVLTPDFVRVQAYVGETVDNDISKPTIIDLTDYKSLGSSGDYIYEGSIPAPESGAYGLNVRVIPTHPDLTQDHELRLITWAR